MSRPVFVMVIPQGTSVQLTFPQGFKEPDPNTPIGVTVDVDDTDEKILPYVSTLLVNIRTMIPNDSRIIIPSDVRNLKQ
jgi:hypothetical protein